MNKVSVCVCVCIVWGVGRVKVCVLGMWKGPGAGLGHSHERFCSGWTGSLSLLSRGHRFLVSLCNGRNTTSQQQRIKRCSYRWVRVEKNRLSTQQHAWLRGSKSHEATDSHVFVLNNSYFCIIFKFFRGLTDSSCYTKNNFNQFVSLIHSHLFHHLTTKSLVFSSSKFPFSPW